MNRDLTKLDLAFLIDTTSSMGPYIDNAKKNLKTIIERIIKEENFSLLRLGLINFRDHPPEDSTYITQINDFTSDFEEAKNFINKSYPSGGGDEPEAVCCALFDCINKLSWSQDSIRIVVLITDAPCHGLRSCADGFADGCPLNHDPVQLAHKMAEKGITLYCCGCEPSLTKYRQFFIALTLITGGRYMPLNDAEALAQIIVGGTREDTLIEKLMAQVNQEVMKETVQKGVPVNEEELTKRIHCLLNSRLSCDNSSAEKIEITDEIREASKMKNLTEMVDFLIKKNILNSYFNALRPISFTKSRSIKSKRFRVYKKKANNDKNIMRFVKSTRAIKTIIETVKRDGPRKSERFKIMNSLTNEATKEIITRRSRISIRPLVSYNDPIDIDLTRRMVKKSIARNKLN